METWKENFKRETENCDFWVVVNKMFLLKWHVLENCKTLFVFGRQDKGNFRWRYLFLENVTKHHKNRGFSRHRGNPKWHFWFEKGVLWTGLRKGFYYLGCIKAVLCRKHYFIVFQQNTALQKSKSVSWKKTEVYQNWGLFANSLVSRGRCGRKIARLRRLAAVVAASFLRFEANPENR